MFAHVIQAILFLSEDGEGIPYAREDSYRELLIQTLMAEDEDGNSSHKATDW
jgi:hypothetical protein